MEETVRSFAIDYEKIIKDREGDGWKNRYEKHFKRLSNPDLHLVVNPSEKVSMLVQADSVAAD